MDKEHRRKVAHAISAAHTNNKDIQPNEYWDALADAAVAAYLNGLPQKIKEIGCLVCASGPAKCGRFEVARNGKCKNWMNT